MIDPKRRKLGPEESGPSEDVTKSPQEEDENQKNMFFTGAPLLESFIIALVSRKCLCLE